MTRPTPAQARLLRALDQYRYVRVLWNGRQAERGLPEYDSYYWQGQSD